MKADNIAVRDYFARENACLYQQLNSVQASVKEKSRKVLELLGLSCPESPSENTAQFASTVTVSDAHEPPTDLLGLDVPSSNLINAQPASQVRETSLIDDGAAAPLATSKESGALFAGMQAETLPGPVCAADVTTNAADGLFGGLHIADSPAAAHTPQPAARIPAPSSSPEVFQSPFLLLTS